VERGRRVALENMFRYTDFDGTQYNFFNADGLREKEICRLMVVSEEGTTMGEFDERKKVVGLNVVEMLMAAFTGLLWFFGVRGLVTPVMTLVVIPIERMMQLLRMLMKDPLGYQSSELYKKFQMDIARDNAENGWSEEVLDGMETSFLMSTIERIGSLMKVGFGSAGVEIIRSSLERSRSSSSNLQLDKCGSTMSSIFLFCDIRNFTDATESLQEEVFVFVNTVAGVVHSICNAYGGNANKNIGDAFLMSWIIDDTDFDDTLLSDGSLLGSTSNKEDSTQADRALLSVVKITIALHHDDVYLDILTQTAQRNLIKKLEDRPGPVVQMGCGLHFGTAMQGAIGSPRKIDPTYLGENVDFSETLETATKKYGVVILMSDAFHNLLHPNTGRKCRKIDQILRSRDGDTNIDVMDLYTYDARYDFLFLDTVEEKPQVEQQEAANRSSSFPSKMNLLRPRGSTSSPLSPSIKLNKKVERELVLPTGKVPYSLDDWNTRDMKRIRRPYSDGLFFRKFHTALLAYYAGDWTAARINFKKLVHRYNDGPSKYFFHRIDQEEGKPPENFLPYNVD